MKYYKSKSLLTLLLISFYANGQQADFDQGSVFSNAITECIEGLTQNEDSEKINWNNTTQNINATNSQFFNCFMNISNQNNRDQSEPVLVKNEYCPPTLFSINIANNSVGEINININSNINTNNQCVHVLPHGNMNQSMNSINRNSLNVSCSATFTCDGNNWIASNVQAERNKQFCESVSLTITNPLFNQGSAFNSYLNHYDLGFNEQGQKTIETPRISPTSDRNYTYSYHYGGYRITHNFNCNPNNLTIEELDTDIQILDACSLDNTNNLTNLTFTGKSANPENPAQKRTISCNLINNTGTVGGGSNALRNRAREVVQSNQPLIFAFETANIPNNNYSFYRNDNEAIFLNNHTKGQAILACGSGGWQIVESACSNIRQNNCFRKFRETPPFGNGINNIREGFFQLDFNPRKRRDIEGNIIEDKIIYEYNTSNTGNACFEF